MNSFSDPNFLLSSKDMGLFKTSPVAYVATSPHNLANLQRLFNSTMRVGDSDFVSDIDVLDDGHHKFVIVRSKKGGPVMAYALLRQDGSDAEVEQLYAFTTQRGRGFGHLALQTAEEVARTHGATALYLDSVPSAAKFYAHEGYMTRDGITFTKAL